MAVHGRRQGRASLSVGMWMLLESKIVLEWQFEVVGHCQCRIHPEEWRSPLLEPNPSDLPKNGRRDGSYRYQSSPFRFHGPNVQLGKLFGLLSKVESQRKLVYSLMMITVF